MDFIAEKDKLCVQIQWNQEEEKDVKYEYTKEVEMKLISPQRHALALFFSIYLSFYLSMKKITFKNYLQDEVKNEASSKYSLQSPC